MMTNLFEEKPHETPLALDAPFGSLLPLVRTLQKLIEEPAAGDPQSVAAMTPLVYEDKPA